MALQQKKRLYKKNDVITTEGDLSFEWYVLVKGKVGVYKGDILMNEFSERGVIFGELSGLLARPRTATMKALEDTEVMVVESSIDEVIRNHPDIANKILISLAERLAKTTDEMWAVIGELEQKK
ncbi:MAG: cyclic nucleotide-binding domain-containing protein [Bacteroidetes bacterium]|nr:cyclic nucleotide-binding domain-containing protein [Bacteroidota bacterium]